MIINFFINHFLVIDFDGYVVRVFVIVSDTVVFNLVVVIAVVTTVLLFLLLLLVTVMFSLLSEDC